MSIESSRYPRAVVLILATCLALAGSASALMIASSALAGKMLSSDGKYATLPLAIQFVTATVSAAPVAFWMRRAGRRVGFMTGSASLVVNGLLSALAIYLGSFSLFIVASVFFGIGQATTLHYRFAAAEAASGSFRAKAISLVLGGGVAAAIIGPNLANLGETILAPYTYAGGYIFLAALGFLNILVLLPIRLAPVAVDSSALPQRPLREIIAQPKFPAALAASMLGYGVMVFMMTATPLAMQNCGFQFGDVAFVLQLHALGMFAPSFITGDIIRKIGERNVLLAGVACYGVVIAVGLAGTDIGNFWVALVLLGIGWNFLFVGGTSLLTKCYRPSERAKVQAFNDTMIFGAIAICSLTAGTVEFLWGWEMVLFGGIVPIMAILGIIVFLGRRLAAPASAAE